MKQTITKLLGGAFLALLFLMPSSVKADPTTLASWTFETGYEVTDNVYTPNTSASSDVTGWFKDGQPVILPNNTFVGTQADYFITGKSDRYWQFCTGNNNRVFRIVNDTEANSITDYTDAAQHDNYYEIQFPTTGYRNISIAYAIAYGNNAAADIHAVYSVDNGTTWKNSNVGYTATGWWTYNENKAYLNADAKNKEKVIVRLIFGNGYSSNWNMDYLTISGESTGDTPSTSTLTFSAPDAEGIAPASVTQALTTTYTIPSNFTLYKENCTLKGWTDGITTYKIGDTYTFTENNMTLFAVFEENTVSLNERTESVTATWNFGKKAGVPEFEFNNSTGFLVTQANVAGETIDLKMDVDATAKLGTYYALLRNKGRDDNDQWAQMVEGIKMTVPSVYGATVELKANSAMSSTKIDNSTDYTSGTTISKAVTSTNRTIDVVGMDGGYYSYLSVTYPVIAVSPTKEFTTYCSTSPLNFTAVDGLEAYVVTGSTNTTITLAKVTDVPASTGLILKKTGSAASYNVPVGTATTLAETNKLVGVTTATTFNAGDYILSNGTFIKGTAGTLAANKAYLPASNIDTSANILSLDFGGTTDIANLKAVNTLENGKFYNLAGQEVAQPQKGLYIVNGKKVIIK